MANIPIRSDPAGAIVPVLVVPGASRTEIIGRHGDRLRVRVAAAPERGRANRAVEALLGEFFGTTATVVAGSGSRRKQVRLAGLDPAGVAERLRIG
jgi:uncharacterized protein (TIGR00251 family)